MSGRTENSSFTGPGIMLLSAAVFGYFGFTTSWNYNSVINGQFLFFVALLDWTLKGTAIGLGLSAVVTFASPLMGNLMYGVVSLASALSFVVVGVLDLIDTQHTAISPILLFIFAAWNGYGSWSGLKESFAMRVTTPPAETLVPPGIG